jgi:hypothetical protein
MRSAPSTLLYDVPSGVPNVQLRRLRTYKSPILCDPCCGRGTGLFAACMREVRAYGIDMAPGAVAIARVKLATFSEHRIVCKQQAYLGQ